MSKAKNFVNIGGQLRPVVFDHWCFYLWSKNTNKPLESLIYAGSLNFWELMELIRSGLYNGTIVDGKPTEISSQQVCNWLSERPEAQGEILAIFFESSTRLWGEPEQGELDPESEISGL